MNTKKVTIIGSGLAGNFLAILLARKGYQVNIYERLSKQEITTNSSKRSYSLTFYSYLASVLKKTALWDALKSSALPIKGSITYINTDKRPVVVTYKESELPYYAIQRNEFVSCLLTEASKYPLISHHYEHSLIGIDRRRQRVYLDKNQSNEIIDESYETLIGADGVNSLVRPLAQSAQACQNSLVVSDWEYKQIAFSPSESRMLGFSEGYIYSWTNDTAILTALPNQDGSYGALLFLPKKGTITFTNLTNSKSASEFINESLPFFDPISSRIIENLLENPMGKLQTLRTSPWNYEGSIAIIGDAAHSLYPFLGQGVSAAFADCMTLIDLLENNHSMTEAIANLEAIRKPNTDIITELSARALTEYRRNRRADYSSVYNKIESFLSSRLPDIIMPPLFMSIMKYPTDAVHYYKKHTFQRKVARFLGIPVIIALLTVSHALFGRMKKYLFH